MRLLEVREEQIKHTARVPRYFEGWLVDFVLEVGDVGSVVGELSEVRLLIIEYQYLSFLFPLG